MPARFPLEKIDVLQLGEHTSLFFTFRVNPGKESKVEFFNWQSAVPRVADQIECLLSAWGGGCSKGYSPSVVIYR